MTIIDLTGSLSRPTHTMDDHLQGELDQIHLYSVTSATTMSPVREVNLVDIGLVSILIYLLIALVRPALRPRSGSSSQRPQEGYQAIPKKHPQCLVYKKFTPRELARFDGKRADGEERLLLAIQRRMKAKDETAERGWREVRLERTVFDVTAGASFYGPGEPNRP
jgi:membrane-associated progesterone receptor component